MRGGRWWRWLPAVLSAATGCTMLMGIDGEYTERTAGVGGGAAGGGDGGGPGGAGGSAGVGEGCALPADCPDTPGDCQTPTCEGGVCTVMPDDVDVPADDGDACTTETCAGGMVLMGLEPAGTPCGGSAGGGGGGGGAGSNVCNGSGSCVECLMTTDCDVEMSCVGGTCVSMCEDGMTNGSETDVDCGGPTQCPRCADGMTCQNDADCVSGFCDDQMTDTCI